jgi:hypothetical protein
VIGVNLSRSFNFRIAKTGTFNEAIAVAASAILPATLPTNPLRLQFISVTWLERIPVGFGVTGRDQAANGRLSQRH